MTDGSAFDRLVAEIGACTICAPHLPLGPRPIVRGLPSARLLIISQAPGRRPHGRRLAAPPRMRAALARAVAYLFLRDRVDPARRPLCDRLLPAGGSHTIHDRGDLALARFPTGTLRPAASELADNALAARQPVVRKRGVARTTRPSSPGDQSDSSIRAMSSSLKPKWWPISWISTWRTTRVRSSPLSHQ